MRRRQQVRATVAGALCTALVLGGAAFMAPTALADSGDGAAEVPAVDVAAPAVAPAATVPPVTTPPVTKPPATKPPVKVCKRPAIPAGSSSTSVLYRPTTKPGMRDAGVFKINHVREAQYRLRWVKAYKGKVNGRYDTATKNAVKLFQTRNCLKATGTLDRASWAILIKKSIKKWSSIPKVCKAKGLHSCYDRSTHQDFLFRNGKLINVWLVRGGMRSAKTRTGTYRVKARYTTKISSLYHVKMWYFMPHSGGQGQHGSGFMIDPFVGHSHGCINMYIQDAKVLFKHAKGKKLKVTVYGKWS